MFSRSIVTVALAVACAGVARVDAHGYLVQPLAKFISQNIDITQYSGTIDSYALFPTGTFNTAPEANVASFVENYENSSYANVREMIVANQVVVSDSATADCGFSDPSKTSYGALNDTIYWGKSADLTGEGFVVGHMGPCETWCDDNLAQQDMNCQVTYNPASGSGAAPVPIDTSKCADASRLTFYWIAMHGSQWQVYINCININGNTSSGSSSGTTTTTTAPATTTAPTATTAAPTATTAAPAATTAAPTATTAAPATTTAAPATTEAPAAADSAADDSAADEYDDEASGEGDATDAPVATTAAPTATTSAPAATEKCTASTRRRRRN
jgi:hypothetical protein